MNKLIRILALTFIILNSTNIALGMLSRVNAIFNNNLINVSANRLRHNLNNLNKKNRNQINFLRDFHISSILLEYSDQNKKDVYDASKASKSYDQDQFNWIRAELIERLNKNPNDAFLKGILSQIDSLDGGLSFLENKLIFQQNLAKNILILCLVIIAGGYGLNESIKKFKSVKNNKVEIEKTCPPVYFTKFDDKVEKCFKDCFSSVSALAMHGANSWACQQRCRMANHDELYKLYEHYKLDQVCIDKYNRKLRKLIDSENNEIDKINL